MDRDAGPRDAVEEDSGFSDAEPAETGPLDGERPGAESPDSTTGDSGSDGSVELDAQSADAAPDAGRGDSGLCPFNGNWDPYLVLPHQSGASASFPLVPGFAISPDGRYVAFSYWDYDIPPYPEDLDRAEIYVHDLHTGATSQRGGSLNGDFGAVAISTGASAVLVRDQRRLHPWLSDDGQLALITTFEEWDFTCDQVYVRLPNGSTELISVRGSITGGPAQYGACDAAMSADGRYVVFRSLSPDLVPNDTEQFGNDIFLRDRLAGTTVAVTADPVTGDPTNDADSDVRPDISADGRYVHYSVGGQTWIWDRAANQRALGDLPPWRRACDTYRVDECWASRDGSTRVLGVAITNNNGILVERVPSVAAPPMIACSPRTTDTRLFYWQSIAEPPLYVRSHTPVWTGSEMLGWGEEGLGSARLAAYAPATDSWRVGSTTGQPSLRIDHTGIWAGDRYIIWGGRNASGSLRDGRAYAPDSNTWSSLSQAGAPSARFGHRVVFTDTEMIVFGGTGLGTDLGGRYSPSTDTWNSLSASGAPAAPAQLFWTGTEVLAWNGTELGRYDPISDQWTTAASGPTSIGRDAAWTGSLFLVWDGVSIWKWDPLTDLWDADPTPPIPMPFGAPPFDASLAFWTGSELIFVGADRAFDLYPATLGPPEGPQNRVLLARLPRWGVDGNIVWAGTQLIDFGIYGARTWAAPP